MGPVPFLTSPGSHASSHYESDSDRELFEPAPQHSLKTKKRPNGRFF